MEHITSCEQWRQINTNIAKLARTMHSSIPEQYIGYYLNKVFSDIEYGISFDWLKSYSLDLYIPSLNLAIEYDGTYYHRNKRLSDNHKDYLCKKQKIKLIRVLECDSNNAFESSSKYTVPYYRNKKYTNIDVVIYEIIKIINKLYRLNIKIDVDIVSDYQDIVSYVQDKYFKKSIAHIWPEIKDYWDFTENECSYFDILVNSNKRFVLKCPKCRRSFHLLMKYWNNRTSLIPCDCEYTQIKLDYDNALISFKENNAKIHYDDSLRNRRLYDYMTYNANNPWQCKTTEEVELLSKMGFSTLYTERYLSLQATSDKK